MKKCDFFLKIKKIMRFIAQRNKREMESILLFFIHNIRLINALKLIN